MAESLLSDELLETFRSRAARYDSANAFFAEDLDDLKAAGYLRAFVPTSLGGAGLDAQAVVREQVRLASAAPSTALGVNMHLIWTGVAKAMLDRGDDSLKFVLDEAAAGELFGFGISERGNDLMLFGSTTSATPEADGGFRFTGTKIFTSLSPAWTRLGLHGLDTSSPDAPKLVYAFIPRGADGVETLDDWDTLGMRATQSNSTRLDGVRAEPDRVVRRVDPGPSADLLLWSIFANFELLLSAVYAGIGARALELATAAATTRKQRDGTPRSQDPDTRWRVADAAITMDGVWPQLDAVARDIDEQVDRGGEWYRLLSGLKVRTVHAVRDVVDQAISLAGGAAFNSSSELGRLYRDVIAGVFQPSTVDSAHSTAARHLLGPLD
ncbi:acyl-CoA dehydrogenase family protein [Cryobacterium sp. BB736]|uniref:acyl-CoA dehydrogenase family protein n=1 Tax=Cryobacterium sp. BB736 TaxID=2746963 RepID=UPI001874EB48